MSQLVVTDADTVFDQTTLATLTPGDVVEVFGVTDADSNIRATRVERKVDFEEFGSAHWHGHEPRRRAETFEIGLLTVDFSGRSSRRRRPRDSATGSLSKSRPWSSRSAT